jgi:ABC-2 type transport system permease protein
MRKFLAVVKREYTQRVRSKLFIFTTIFGPVVISLFGIVPAVIFNIRAGEPVRIAIVDETGRLYQRVHDLILNDVEESDEEVSTSDNARGIQPEPEAQPDKLPSAIFQLEQIPLNGRSIEEIKTELNERVRTKNLDGYVILPANLIQGKSAEFYGRNTGDVFTRGHLARAVNQAVREERLSVANIDVNIVRELSRRVDLRSFKVSERGEERDRGEGFILVFAVGFVIYLTILMYGQIILGAVIEEKETRIAEILFSSLRPFTLMIGKLIGISLVALTQFGIWGIAFIVFVVLGARELSINIPDIPPIVFVYFGLFFLLGYFIYATIYALIGSMVTTAQEGGQLAMPIILLLVIGFYFAFPIIQSPDSSMAFWMSMVPFFSPITMLVRIVALTPPFWQIALSLMIGFATVLLLLWVAARIYRMGMLMYGKRVSIPEAWRWVRES